MISYESHPIIYINSNFMGAPEKTKEKEAISQVYNIFYFIKRSLVPLSPYGPYQC